MPETRYKKMHVMIICNHIHHHRDHVDTECEYVSVMGLFIIIIIIILRHEIDR